MKLAGLPASVMGNLCHGPKSIVVSEEESEKEEAADQLSQVLVKMKVSQWWSV